MKNIKWQDHVKNEELRIVKEERAIVKRLRYSKDKGNGRTLTEKKYSLLTEVLEGRSKGKKAKGRPKQKLYDNLLNGKTYEKGKRETQDWTKWKEEQQTKP